MNQNEAETPNRGPLSMADMVGFMMRDLFSHGINMEEHLAEAQQGARNLSVQLRLAHQEIAHLTAERDALKARLEATPEDEDD